MRVQNLVVTIFMIMIAVKRVAAAGTSGFFKTIFFGQKYDFCFHFQLMAVGAVGLPGQIVQVDVDLDIREDKG